MLLKLRFFNHGFVRFFQSVDDWLLLLDMSYDRLEKILGRRPYQIEDYRKRFFGGITQ